MHNEMYCINYFQQSVTGTLIIFYHSKQIFLIGREPTTWSANNCLEIMVCSCAMSSNCVWLWRLAATNILLMRKWNQRFSPSCDRCCVKNKLGDRMIKQLLDSLIAKYRDLSESRRWIMICLPLTNHDIIFNNPPPFLNRMKLPWGEIALFSKGPRFPQIDNGQSSSFFSFSRISNHNNQRRKADSPL